jgi:diguanylate cyclase (GGDEF)-like protein
VTARARTTPAAQMRTADWRRAHAGSGVTSRLILTYVQREAGRAAVEQLLARAHLADVEDRLSDENHWFSYEDKLALWTAAEEVLSDPQIAEHVGAAALDMSVALGLKRALRALGTPGFVFGNVVRANAKFNWAHELVVTARSPESVSMRYRDLAGVGYHRYDCEYTKGLLSTVPQLFGLPPARVTHAVCGAQGADCCEFDVRWGGSARGLERAALAVAAAAGAMAGAGALTEPALLPAAAGLFVAGELGLAARALAFMRRRIAGLELRVREQDDAAMSLLGSLQNLSSDLRLDEVLDQVTARAQSAIGGKEFVLLLADHGSMRADRHSGVPAGSLRALEGWAREHRPMLARGKAVVIDDLAADRLLAALPTEEPMPLGSMCAAPLVFRGQLLGVLAALAHGSTVFLPGDAASLSAYAGHAAIALSNARLVASLERQASEDPLTGLANQRSFQQHCLAAFSRAERTGDEVAIVMLDLDWFKAINDEHGHPYGDQVLIAVANALRGCTRAGDTAARLGGEEFALLLPDAGALAAADVAERVRTLIAEIPVPGLTLSCSAGIATSATATGSPEQLREQADKALYQAKRLGRDRTVHWPEHVGAAGGNGVPQAAAT